MNFLTRFFKYICMLLLLTMSIQLSGLDCVADEVPINTEVIQLEYLQTSLPEAIPDSDKNFPDSSHDNDEHLCPCHLTFTESLTLGLTSFNDIATLVILPEPSLVENIPNSFFQPPKNIL